MMSPACLAVRDPCWGILVKREENNNGGSAFVFRV